MTIVIVSIISASIVIIQAEKGRIILTPVP